MCVRASPLEVDTVVLINSEFIWYKVVLHGRVHLDNVPTLPTDVQIVNSAGFSFSVVKSTSWAELHDVGTILEGAAELSCVDGQSKRLVSGGADVNSGVLLDRRTNIS